MKRVLVVEDDATVGRLVKRVFEERGGLSVILVEKIADARRHVEAVHFQAIVADRELPDGSGLEFLRETRQLPAYDQVPFVLWSGDLPPAEKMAARAEGFHCFDKPTNPLTLLAVLGL
jgi:two-component system catabolic regulation response regulator CreB